MYLRYGWKQFNRLTGNLLLFLIINKVSCVTIPVQKIWGRPMGMGMIDGIIIFVLSDLIITQNLFDVCHPRGLRKCPKYLGDAEASPLDRGCGLRCRSNNSSWSTPSTRSCYYSGLSDSSVCVATCWTGFGRICLAEPSVLCSAAVRQPSSTSSAQSRKVQCWVHCCSLCTRRTLLM